MMASSASDERVFFGGRYRYYHELTAREQVLYDRTRDVSFVLCLWFFFQLLHLYTLIYIQYSLLPNFPCVLYYLFMSE